MILAGMMATDETALICDLAQTYGVLHYRDLPVPLLAALAAGLGEDARIIRKISGNMVSTNTMLLAAAVDRLSLMLWSTSVKNNTDQPPSILSMLLADPEDSTSYAQFASADDFWAARNGIIGSDQDGQ